MMKGLMLKMDNLRQIQTIKFYILTRYLIINTPHYVDRINLPDAALLRYLAKLSAVEQVSAKPDDLAAAAALKLDNGGLLEKSTGSDCVSSFDLPVGFAVEEDVADFECDEGKPVVDDE